MRRLIAPLVVAVLLLTACTSEEEPKPVPTESVDPAAVDEQAVIDTYKAYWDLYVSTQNSGNIDPAAFGQLAAGNWMEHELATLRNQAEIGVLRVGEPELSEYSASVDGDQATAQVCLNEHEWGAKSGDRVLESPEDATYRIVATLERREDRWVITDMTGAGETCE